MGRVAALAALVLGLVVAALYLRGGDGGGDTTAAAGRVDHAPAPSWTKVGRTTHEGQAPAPAGDVAVNPSQDVQVDQQRFGSLRAAGSALTLANAGPNLTRDQLSGLVETLDAQVTSARGLAHTETEIEMVAFYADALATYRDGLQFWELRRFAKQPGEDRSLDELATKYGIHPVRRISYTSTWEEYPNAFSTIWAVGDAAAAKGSALFQR